MNYIDITGQKFGNLTAIRFDHVHIKPSGQVAHYWLFRCDCGKEKIMLKNSVKNGAIISCGCKKYHPKHGLYRTRIYSIWESMKARCFNEHNKKYSYYGGRGITVCKEWAENAEAFYKWAMDNGYNDNLTIDRIDVNGNYCPENCRWITQKQQKRNTRKNHMLTYKGETRCISEWAEILGIKVSTIFGRVQKGLNVELVLSRDKLA